MTLPPTLIPRTNLAVSRLVLGTANLGVKQTEAEAYALLDHYVGLGGNFIDAARVYSDWIPGETGRCERILGDWLRARPGLRSRLVIATKGLHYRWSEPTGNRVNAAAAREDVEASLLALGIDCIDLYWLHRDNPKKPVEEIVDFMQPLVASGKIRYLGVANWSGARLAAANAYAARHDLVGFVANQPLFNIGSWQLRPPSDPTLVDLDRSTYAWHRAQGVALVPYSSQAQGYFSYVTTGRAEALSVNVKNRYDTPANRALAVVIARLAAAKGCTVNSIVLAYLLHQPLPVFPIIGANDTRQLEDSFTALTVQLSPKELQLLEEATGSAISHPIP
jgi:aryl-alcohol dehydrogenase-like predicted oxidoreductase